MKKIISRYYPHLIIIIIGIFLVSHLLRPNWYASHDGIFHIYRTEEALSMLKLGQFPLRWAGNFDQGFGIPLFTFIYPLPYYISAALSVVFGAMWSLKLLTISAYILGGLGIYALFPKLEAKTRIALALIYLMTPYQFLNIFVRGTIGEILAIGLMPWVLTSFSHLWQSSNQKIKWYHPLPLALVLISHNFLGILFSAFLLLYVLFNHKNIKASLLSLILSFGLAAFFLIPMITEKNYLYSFANGNLTFRFDQHFVTVKQLLYGKWDYWYSVPGDQDGMSFQLGVAQLTLSLLGIAIIVYTHKSIASFYLVVAYLGSLLLMHQKSLWIWQHLPLLQAVQFPWRFLFMPLLLTPFFAAELFKQLSKKVKNFVLFAFLILAFINVRNYRSPLKFFDNTEYTDLYRLYYNKTSTTLRTEILPRWSVKDERYKNDEILVNSGNMTIDSLSYDPLKIVVTINNKPDPSNALVTVLRNYYPGWVAYTESGNRIDLTPTQEGMINFSPIQGIHTYTISIKSTTTEVLSNMITIISIITIGYLWYANSKNHPSTTRSK